MITLGLLEFGTRVVFATKTGARTMLYGTPWQRNEHSPPPGNEVMHEALWRRAHTVNMPRENAGRGYKKFFPYESRRTYDVDRGQVFEVRINNHGFRGEDFVVDKPPGVTRIITLGSSSTFGYYDRDDETYPFYLEAALTERCGAGSIEVLNLGVPHLISEEIAALFLSEGLSYQPDIVTLYSGNNDSMIPPPEELSSQVATAKWRSVESLARHSLVVRFLSYLSEGGEMSSPVGDGLIGIHARRRSQFFLQNVELIANACEERGITFIVMNQQKKSTSWWPSSAAYRERMRNLTYRQEIAQTLARLEIDRNLTNFELSMLVHGQMMEALESWAKARHVPFADIIEELDHDRHLLLSYVHLHPDANRMIAARLADLIGDRLDCAQSGIGQGGAGS
jgi:lysophospholipase L1-like esterase